MRGVSAAGGEVSREKQVWKKGEGWREHLVQNGDVLVNSEHFQCAEWFGCSLNLSLLPGIYPAPPSAACWGVLGYHWGSCFPRT